MKTVSTVVLAASLAFTAQAATASPSSKAFEEFQNRCVAQVVNGDTHAMDGLEALPTKDTQRILAALGADPSQADKTRIWLTSSDRYLLFTMVKEDAFCQLVGFQVDFPEMRSAYLKWREKYAKGYKSDSDFELKPMKPVSLNKKTAGVFMAKPTDDGGVLQVFVQYRPEFLKGFASIILIRLPVMSPAAKELLQRK